MTDTTDDQTIWRDYARIYELLYQLYPLQDMLRQVVLQGDITSGTSVLDLGAGTGFLLRRLQALELTPNVTLVDRSLDMLDRAQRVWYSGDAEFYGGDLDQAPTSWRLQSPHFDRITMINSLYAVADPVATLRQVLSLAHTETKLIVSTPRAQPNIDAIMAEHLSRYSRETGDRGPKELNRIRTELEPLAAFNRRNIVNNHAFHFPTMSRLEAWLAEAGWEVRYLGVTYANQNWLIVAIPATKP